MKRRMPLKYAVGAGVFMFLLVALNAPQSFAGGTGNISKIEARMKELGISLPDAPKAVATYASFRRVGNLVFISGQGPARSDAVKTTGIVGDDMTTQEGYQTARLVGLNVLAQAKAACDGDLDRIVQFVQLTGFVQAVEGYTDHPSVINGASDLLVEILGDKGRHARAAIGVKTLPFNIAVEIQAVFEIAP